MSLPIKRRTWKIGRYVDIALPTVDRLYQSVPVDHLRVELYLTPERKLKVVFKGCGEPRVYLYQAIRLMQHNDRVYPNNTVGVRVNLNLTWDILPDAIEQNVRLYSDANGYFMLDNETKEKYIVLAGDDILLADDPIFPGLTPPAHATKEEVQFIYLVAELDERLSAGENDRKQYDHIRAGAILRDLLLDNNNGIMINKFAKNNGLEPSFAVRDFDENIPGGSTANSSSSQHVFVSLSVDRLPGVKRKVLNLAGFLNHRAHIINGVSISVREVIQTVAHGKGGHHSSLRASKTNQKVMLDYDSQFFADKIDYSLQILFHIGRTTLKTLEPIIDAIMTRNSNV